MLSWQWSDPISHCAKGQNFSYKRSETLDNNAEIKYDYKNINSIAITIPANKKLKDAEKFFKSVKGVILVNRDYINKVN